MRIVVKAATEMDDKDFIWIKNPPNTFIARLYFDPQKMSFHMPTPLPKREPIAE